MIRLILNSRNFSIKLKKVEKQIMNTIIIGLGPHGNRVLKAVQSIDKLNLFGLVDLSPEVLEAVDTNGAVIKTDNLDQLLSQHKIEVACITTNGPSHAALATQCIKAGVKYIMVEKPLACSVEECQQMIDTANKYDVKLIVDHPRRVSKNYGLVQEMIAQGELGEIRNIYIQRPGIGLGCLATHSFDLASYFVDKPVKAVTGWVDEPKKNNPRGDKFVDPGGTVVLDYGDGVKGLISQIEDGAGPIFVEINLTGGRVHIDEKTDRLEIIKRDLTVKKMPGKPAGYDHIINPEGIGGKRNLVDEITWLLEDLINNTEPKSRAQYGYDSIETLVAAYVSHESGHIPVSIPLEKKHHSKWLPIT
jgi:predicted dehydrogenase